jgi:hypothetical protein
MFSLITRRDNLYAVPSGAPRWSSSPYLRLVLAEFVDVGISEHTEKVCAMPHERQIFRTSPQSQSFRAGHFRVAPTFEIRMGDSSW